jgi:hypothetical protein
MRVRPFRNLRSFVFAILIAGVFATSSVKAQITLGMNSQADGPASVRGKVLNRITHEPISRALVFSPDQRYAMLTDDRGRFEFKFPARVPEPKEELTGTLDASVYRFRELRMVQNGRPNIFYARKPGFLQSNSNPSSNLATSADPPEIVIYLEPESLIVGNVNLPGSEGDMRIRVQIYRRQIVEGQEHWQEVRTFTTWADGEFRFSELEAGTYKVGTNELLDRNPTVYTPGGQLFGFAPIFYPGISDFGSAGAIQLAAGATVQINLAPTRQAYYTVKIPVMNAGDGRAMSMNVYPLGHPGPGYSLGYNSNEQMIQGTLPDGNYTLQASTQGPTGSTGMLNFSVQGASRDGQSINLIPNASVAVTVKEEFKAAGSVFGEVNGGAEDEGANVQRQRQVSVQVVLQSVEEFGAGEAAVSEPMPGTQEHTLLIPNIRPGRYRVHVQSGVGYAASVVYGGSNLLRQPLVVGLGGASQPMEITLRDDGAEVDGKMDAAGEGQVYFVPLDESSGEFREGQSTPDGSFDVAQVPPGTYLVLAFIGQHNELAYADAEAMRKLVSKGQVIHLEAGQKAHLSLKPLGDGDLQ